MYLKIVSKNLLFCHIYKLFKKYVYINYKKMERNNIGKAFLFQNNFILALYNEK